MSLAARASLLVALVIASGLAGCLDTQGALIEETAGSDPAQTLVDPTLSGPLAVTRTLFDAGSQPHANTEQPSAYALRVRGSIHAPTDGDGPFPVVVLQHGRHATCAVAGQERSLVLGFVMGPAGHCPEAAPLVEPVNSYAGYDALAENLASHGFVVASVDANGVNDIDGAWQLTPAGDAGAQARADLVLRTLDALARANAGEENPEWAAPLEGRLDMTRVGLMGHSRGGEGVTTAIHANSERPESERHAIRAVFALAPIDATSVTAPDVAFATMLPYCDGDVWSLSGARIFDDTLPDASPKVQILVLGANHNYYNTVWTFDDADYRGEDPHCDDANRGEIARLTSEEQHRQGVAHMASFFRLHLAGERGLAPLFESGSTGLPGVHVSTTPPASAMLELPAPTDMTGFARAETCAPPECDGAFATGSAERLLLAWNAPARLAWTLPDDARDLTGFDALVLRAAVDPADDANARLTAQDFRVVIVDGAGREAAAVASDWSRALFVPPGGEAFQRAILNDLRLPLAAFEGVALDDARELRIEFDQTPSGSIHLGRAAFHEPFDASFGA